jgi:hypothetical protein
VLREEEAHLLYRAGSDVCLLSDACAIDSTFIIQVGKLRQTKTGRVSIHTGSSESVHIASQHTVAAHKIDVLHSQTMPLSFSFCPKNKAMEGLDLMVLPVISATWEAEIRRIRV